MYGQSSYRRHHSPSFGTCRYVLEGGFGECPTPPKPDKMKQVQYAQNNTSPPNERLIRDPGMEP